MNEVGTGSGIRRLQADPVGPARLQLNGRVECERIERCCGCDVRRR